MVSGKEVSVVIKTHSCFSYFVRTEKRGTCFFFFFFKVKDKKIHFILKEQNIFHVAVNEQCFKSCIFLSDLGA